MKILYATDMHAAFDNLKIFSEYTKKSNPDLIIVSGDLADIAFGDPRYIKNHQGLAKKVWGCMIQNEPGLKRLTPYEVKRALPIFAEKIYKNPPDKDLEELAEDYLRSLDFLEGNLDIQYDLLKSMLEKSGTGYKVLPGNHDKDLQLSSLKENDMHKKTMEKNGIIISCFGSANDFQHGDIVPFETPVELTVPFNEYPDSQGQTISEIFNFLIKEKPDIAFTHIPPKGLRDLAVHPLIHRLGDKEIIKLLHQGGPALLAYIQQSNSSELTKFLRRGGSPGLLEYLKQGHTRIICCGHIHESVGVEKIDTENDSVIVFNGGSLRDGYFGELHIDDETKKMDKISLYQVKQKLLLPGHLTETLDVNNVRLIMEYFLTPSGELKKMKIDLEDPYDY